MADDIHEIYAIRYGHHERRSSENFIGGDPHDQLSALNYFVWAIKGPHGTFVVDTGLDEAMATKRGRTVDKPIGEGLRALGIAPDTIAKAIVTHLHFDHAGNHDLFPRARYHMQDTEMAYATGRCMCHAQQRWPFEAEDVVAMVRKVFAGRVEFHDGDDELAPGITLHKIGGHSMGLQCVRVKTRRGYVVLASDATHLYRHIEEGRIFPVVHNAATCSRATRRSNASPHRLCTSFPATIPRCSSAFRRRSRAWRTGSRGSTPIRNRSARRARAGPRPRGDEGGEVPGLLLGENRRAVIDAERHVGADEGRGHRRIGHAGGGVERIRVPRAAGWRSRCRAACADRLDRSGRGSARTIA